MYAVTSPPNTTMVQVPQQGQYQLHAVGHAPQHIPADLGNASSQSPQQHMATMMQIADPEMQQKIHEQQQQLQQQLAIQQHTLRQYQHEQQQQQQQQQQIFILSHPQHSQSSHAHQQPSHTFLGQPYSPHTQQVQQHTQPQQQQWYQIPHTTSTQSTQHSYVAHPHAHPPQHAQPQQYVTYAPMSVQQAPHHHQQQQAQFIPVSPQQSYPPQQPYSGSFTVIPVVQQPQQQGNHPTFIHSTSTSSSSSSIPELVSVSAPKSHKSVSKYSTTTSSSASSQRQVIHRPHVQPSLSHSHSKPLVSSIPFNHSTSVTTTVLTRGPSVTKENTAVLALTMVADSPLTTSSSSPQDSSRKRKSPSLPSATSTVLHGTPVRRHQRSASDDDAEILSSLASGNSEAGGEVDADGDVRVRDADDTDDDEAPQQAGHEDHGESDEASSLNEQDDTTDTDFQIVQSPRKRARTTMVHKSRTSTSSATASETYSNSASLTQAQHAHATKPYSFSKANLSYHAQQQQQGAGSSPTTPLVQYHPNSYHVTKEKRRKMVIGVENMRKHQQQAQQQSPSESGDGDEEGGDNEICDADESGSPSSSSRSRYCLPCPLILSLPKVPLQTLFLQVERQYTISKKEMEGKGMTQKEREELVAVPVRIMGAPNSGTTHQQRELYFVAKDICLLISIRKGNVAKQIGQFSIEEKVRLPVLCSRSNGTSSTHVLTALSIKGLERLLGNAKSPIASQVLKFMMKHVRGLNTNTQKMNAETGKREDMITAAEATHTLGEISRSSPVSGNNTTTAAAAQQQAEQEDTEMMSSSNIPSSSASTSSCTMPALEQQQCSRRSSATTRTTSVSNTPSSDIETMHQHHHHHHNAVVIGGGEVFSNSTTHSPLSSPSIAPLPASSSYTAAEKLPLKSLALISPAALLISSSSISNHSPTHSSSQLLMKKIIH